MILYTEKDFKHIIGGFIANKYSSFPQQQSTPQAAGTA